MSELISRQAVLKHIEKIRQEAQMMDDTRRASIIMNGMYLCEKAVMNQPSAQPERTCVSCGRTVNNGGWYADGRTRCPIEEHYALPKDGYCHLWEKRNVTDDDYPERREE
jgi:hypothetical protein